MGRREPTPSPPRPLSRFPNWNQTPQQILPKFLTSETPPEQFAAWAWGWRGGPHARVWEGGACAALGVTKPARGRTAGAPSGDPGLGIQRSPRGRKELNARPGREETGVAKGGPGPALCHTVMSTRCGAACGRADGLPGPRPARARPRLFPGPELRLRLRPPALRPRLLQTSAYQRVPEPRPLTAAQCPRELSEATPISATSHAPCQLSLRTSAPPLW